MITPISQLSSIHGMEKTEQTDAQTGVFGSIFQSAIQNVKETSKEKSQAEYLLATGQLDNPAALTIAAGKSQVAVDLLVQMRNKALEAYNELTRINM